MFTRVYASRFHAGPLSGDTITRMLTARVKAAGLPAEWITAHALRAGHATTVALAGVPLERIAAQPRHRDSPCSSSATSAARSPRPYLQPRPRAVVPRNRGTGFDDRPCAIIVIMRS